MIQGNNKNKTILLINFPYLKLRTNLKRKSISTVDTNRAIKAKMHSIEVGRNLVELSKFMGYFDFF